MSALRRVLIVGATGKQGGAVVDALLSSPNAASFMIFAPTRDPQSASAQRLAAKSKNIKTVKGQMEDAQAIFKEIGEKIDTVFGVTIPSLKKSEKHIEEIQGKSLVDAAVSNGVKNFVFTSVDRGGDKSDTDPTYVPHFATKYNVEVYLKEKAKTSGMSWTILRPVFFLDNLQPGFFGKVIASCWAAMDSKKKLQVVSVKDVGIIGAKAIIDPEQYKNRALALAGDELTFTEANEIFRANYAKNLPRTFDILASGLKYMLTDIKLMFQWFSDSGCRADVVECRRINPEMQTFQDWLKVTGKHQA
ncbi:NmrA-like family protein [Phlyctema vagabunda]|uniref:NmrA-like family protein n=1 Tax=Phlyctema vagabunda TaxID=108571 RepID=A0ABR4PYF8_9HELO